MRAPGRVDSATRSAPSSTTATTRTRWCRVEQMPGELMVLGPTQVVTCGRSTRARGPNAAPGAALLGLRSRARGRRSRGQHHVHERAAPEGSSGRRRSSGFAHRPCRPGRERFGRCRYRHRPRSRSSMPDVPRLGEPERQDDRLSQRQLLRVQSSAASRPRRDRRAASPSSPARRSAPRARSADHAGGVRRLRHRTFFGCWLSDRRICPAASAGSARPCTRRVRPLRAAGRARVSACQERADERRLRPGRGREAERRLPAQASAPIRGPPS